MSLIALLAATFGVLLTILNLSKTAADWRQQRRQQRMERKQEELVNQIEAWRGIVSDLGDQLKASDDRIDRLDKRQTEIEGKLKACEDERDQMYMRLQGIAKDRRRGAGTT